MELRAHTESLARLWENLGVVVGAAAITALCARVSLGYPVPTTLQTFAVLGFGALLGARRGAASQLLYLAPAPLERRCSRAVTAGWTG